MDHRRPKLDVVTTLRKRRPDELPHFFERFPNWHPIREARKFPCDIPTMAQTTIQPRALAEWRTNFNCLPVSFERQKEKNRHRPRLLFFFRHACSPPAQTIYLSAAFTSPSKKLKVF